MEVCCNIFRFNNLIINIGNFASYCFQSTRHNYKPESPPMTIVLLLSDVTRKNIPSPFIHDQSKRQERQLVHGLGEEVIYVMSCIIHRPLDQSKGLEMPGRWNRKGYCFSNCFMKTCKLIKEKINKTRQVTKISYEPGLFTKYVVSFLDWIMFH